jgi:hypothetical protein
MHALGIIFSTIVIIHALIHLIGFGKATELEAGSLVLPTICLTKDLSYLRNLKIAADAGNHIPQKNL